MMDHKKNTGEFLETKIIKPLNPIFNSPKIEICRYYLEDSKSHDIGKTSSETLVLKYTICYKGVPSIIS